MGIGHPGSKDRVLPYVLGDFSKDEATWLVPFLDAVGDAAPLLASGKAPDFMTRVALLTQPA
jgi:PTH1 family peptidyl-tRNA hydrolase